MKKNQNSKRRETMNVNPDFATLNFVRKFRWTLSFDHLHEQYIKSVNFDWLNNVIEFEAYETNEDGEIPIIEWIDRFKNETAVFTTYDGCGVALYEYKFSGLNLISDKSDFDYTSSDISTRKVTIHYDKREYQPMHYVEVKMPASNRSNIQCDVTKLHFLNDYISLMGKLTNYDEQE